MFGEYLQEVFGLRGEPTWCEKVEHSVHCSVYYPSREVINLIDE